MIHGVRHRIEFGLKLVEMALFNSYQFMEYGFSFLTMGAFLRPSTEQVMLEKSLVSSDHFSKFRSSKKVILGRQRPK